MNKKQHQEKIKVLLVVPNFYQAIGIMAQRIVESCPEIDFYILRSSSINRNYEYFLKLCHSVHVVHFLSNVFRINLVYDDFIEKIGRPTISTVHHVSPGESEKITIASHFDIIHVESKEWLGYITDKTDTTVVLAHQPLNIEKIRKQNYRLNKNPFRIGSFGYVDSLQNRKRMDVLLESLINLKNRGIYFEFVVQGPNWGNILHYFTKEGITVRNLGFSSRNKYTKAYREIDLYVCSSEIEGGPMPVIEALASGIPVVSTKVGVSIELLENGGGILVEKNNPIQIANAIERILRNTDLYLKMKESTLDALKMISPDVIQEEYMYLYRKAIITWETKYDRKLNLPMKTLFFPSLQRKIQISQETFQITKNSGR